MNPWTEGAANHDIIVIGASAGGVEALRRLVPLLPTDLQAAIFVVMHVLPHSRSYLPDLLGYKRSNVRHAVDGARIEHGRIYIAPPNCHLLIEPGHMHLSSGPKENRHRPAINPLFRSASLAYGPRVVGVILTGNLDDGTLGLWEIKRRGGVAIVQDPEEAVYPGMPRSAISNVDVDFITRLDDLPELLGTLAGSVATEASGVNMNMESRLTRVTCPECRGPLDEQQGGTVREFRCRVGHAFAPAALLAAHAETVERTLWAGVVALEEGADLAREMQSVLPADSERLKQEERAKQEMADRVRAVLSDFVAKMGTAESDQ